EKAQELDHLGRAQQVNGGNRTLDAAIIRVADNRLGHAQLRQTEAVASAHNPGRCEVKNLKCFIGLCIVIAIAAVQIVFAQNTYKTYANARFKYSISYPADLLVPQGEAENGDGQIFHEKSASSVEMRVYGGNNALNETLRTR